MGASAPAHARIPARSRRAGSVCAAFLRLAPYGSRCADEPIATASNPDRETAPSALHCTTGTRDRVRRLVATAPHRVIDFRTADRPFVPTTFANIAQVARPPRVGTSRPVAFRYSTASASTRCKPGRHQSFSVVRFATDRTHPYGQPFLSTSTSDPEVVLPGVTAGVTYLDLR